MVLNPSAGLQIFKTKCLVCDKFGYFSCLFPPKILYTIRYSVFGIRIVRPNSSIRIRCSDFLNTKLYLAFGIWIFSIANSIQYSVFGDF